MDKEIRVRQPYAAISRHERRQAWLELARNNLGTAAKEPLVAALLSMADDEALGYALEACGLFGPIANRIGTLMSADEMVRESQALLNDALTKAKANG